jgi:hypothetical protein
MVRRTTPEGAVSALQVWEDRGAAIEIINNLIEDELLDADDFILVQEKVLWIYFYSEKACDNVREAFEDEDIDYEYHDTII